MIQLLFTVLGAEVGVVLVLLFRTPLRKLAILGLDRLKRGRGPVMVKTVAATVAVVLSSSLYSMLKIRSRSAELGSLTPTDQVLFSRHLLEASLMGYSLFLALIIDRLHHYIRELRGLRKNMEAVMKQNRVLEEAKSGSSEEIGSLKEQIEKLKAESETKSEEVKAAQASARALKKQSEGFLLEYDRLLEENQNLREQLQSIDLLLSHSDSKKQS
ncbi:B-cell receptor-associated protein 31-like [Ananas comosus]|uniref:Endoplasmic reticulum transmembrane protein n=1 Tax=Ananas comosus TaxID=4615 RepID=A0A6P5F2K8_ANACO|nr:B-cell receptor-associated protein 31-like [Ananas comosus]